METMLVTFLFAITLGQMGYIVYQSRENRKQIDSLTSKLVAKSLGEYASATKVEAQKETTTKKEVKLNDPVLGKIF